MQLITDKITKLRKRIKADLTELIRLERAIGMSETTFEFKAIG